MPEKVFPTLNKVLDVILSLHADRPALSIKEEGVWRTLTYRELSRRSLAISTYLIRQGFKKNTRACILCESSPEWAVSFFGGILSGCIICPLDLKLRFEELYRILEHFRPQVIFSSSKQVQIVRFLKEETQFVERVIVLDKRHYAYPGFVGLEEILREKNVLRYRRIKNNDTCLVVYTSGTTGFPKGVEITFSNLLFQVMSSYLIFSFRPKDRFLSLLPLNHMLEITGGLIAPLYAGSHISYLPSLTPKQISQALKEVRPTVMLVVPSIIKLFYKSIKSKIDKIKPHKRFLFYFFLRLNRILRVFKMDLSWLFFREIRQYLSSLRYFICGGAPLNKSQATFFDALGIPVYEGYGLTETSPVVAVNCSRYNRYGSVGKPLPGVEIRINSASPQEEGEILVKGPGVMKGYYLNPRLTSEVVRGGWLYTGDLGFIDKKGFLYITGRLKNLIVLSSGKKIHPEEIEGLLLEHPLIKEACVMKDPLSFKERILALIVPDEKSIEEKGLSSADFRRLIEDWVAKINGRIAEYKRIHSFKILHRELPKTSTQKLKRTFIREALLEKSLSLGANSTSTQEN